MKSLRIQQPVTQGIGILVLMLLSMLILTIYQHISDTTKNGLAYWEIMATFLLFFAIVNALMALRDELPLVYWRNSLLTCAGLLTVGIFLTTWFSGIQIYDAGALVPILKVFAFAYFVLISIANLIRFFMYFAKQEQRRD